MSGVNATAGAVHFSGERRAVMVRLPRRAVFTAVLFVLGLYSPLQADTNKDLVKAVTKGDMRAAEKELRKGASPDAEGPDGVPVLVMAAGQCRAAIVNLLTVHGASMEKNGESAVKAAAAEQCGCGGVFANSSVTDYLLKHGAPYPAPGTTACSRSWVRQGTEDLTQLASMGDSAEISAELDKPRGLVSQYADRSAALRAGVDAGKMNSAMLLLAAGANPNLAGEGGKTPLMSAAEQGRVEMVQALLAAGADPSRTDAEGQKAVNYAFGSGDDTLIKMLVPKGQPLTLSLVTVGKEREVYLSKAASEAKQRMHWKIWATLGKTDLSLKSIADENKVMGLAAGMSSFFDRLQAKIIWEVAPSQIGDSLEFDSGSWLLGPQSKAMPAPVSFGARLPATGEKIWIASDGGETILLRPILYLAENGSLMLGGSIAIYASSQFVTSTLTPQEVALDGSVRFPVDRWIAVKPGFRIRGGGLHFDDTGISLMAGTQYVEDSAAKSVNNQN